MPNSPDGGERPELEQPKQVLVARDITLRQ